jgi:hypothetical protein
MKTASSITLVLALFIATVMLTSASLLSSFVEANHDIRMDDLSVGRLGPMLSGPTLWSSYPSFPRASTAFHGYSMLLVGAVVTIT